MRVISQDGTIDVPYDYFSLSVASGKYEDVEVAYIHCHNLSSPNGTKLAEYSTEAKAIKAMEMLRTSYKRNLAMGLMSEKARRVFANAESSMSNMEIMMDISEELTEFEYFQFPQDDEIEV